MGARYSPTLNHTFLVSLLQIDGSAELHYFYDDNENLFTQPYQGQQGEAQWLYKEDRWNAITGFGRFYNQFESYYLGEKFYEFSSDQNSVYSYFNLQFPESVAWTLGVGYDANEVENFSLNQWSPKLGLRWNMTDQLVLRAAAFQVVKRDMIVNQTIEPTQVAGFNQFFDDADGTSSRNYGIGLDAQLRQNLWGGLEWTRRDLEMPFGIGGPFEIEEDQENGFRVYLYGLLDRNWSVTAEYLDEKFEMLNGQYRRTSLPTRMETATLPINIRYFNPGGWFAGVGATYVHQRVDFDPIANPGKLSGGDDFTLVNATVGYRLPKRWGIVALEINNLFDQDFQFQDYSFQTASDNTLRFPPERTWLARLILNFN